MGRIADFANGFDDFTLVVLLVMCVGVVIVFTHFRAKAKAVVVGKQAADEVNNLRSRVLVVAGDRIPGKEIKTVLGHVTGTAKSAASQEEVDASEQLAMLAMMKNAIGMGANAIIDVRLTTSSYQTRGSEWQVSKPTYTGTAVII